MRTWSIRLGLVLLVLAAALGWDRYLRPTIFEAPLPEIPLSPELRAVLAQPDSLALPKAGGPVVQHVGFASAYSEAHEQPAWVAYRITRARLENPTAKGRRRFRPDPAVATGTADHHDYRRSGYTRGHLYPAGAARWDSASLRESFYFSNVSPQLQGFNGGIWRALEEHLREIARREREILVVSGPVLRSGLPTLPQSRVAVPDSFFKVVLDISPPTLTAVGFLLPHAPSAARLQTFAVSVDQVEAVTGLDFFPRLPDAVETVLEAHYHERHWFQ